MHPRELSAVRDADALTALAELDDILATTGSRAELVYELRTHLPGLLLADRITLGLQSADASQVEMTVLVGDGDDTDETYLRPTAGSSLQRARDIGVLHLTDLDRSPVPQDVALANRGYRERLVLPLRFGDATIGILSLSTRAPITDETVTVARLAAAIVSTRSHRFGVPEPSDDARTLETQIAQLRHAAHALERTDPLTRLPNRVAVFEAIDEARVAAALGTHSAFAFIDLDHYKITNDKHGHKTGDIVLQSLADRLRGLSGEAPVAFGRVGGDEFGALYYGEAEDLKALLDRLGAELTSHPLVAFDEPVPTTFSAGVFRIDGHGHGIEEIVSRAEGAAYQAKRAGRNRVIVHTLGDPGHQATHEEMRQIDVMRSAINDGRLSMVAQPVRAIRAGLQPPMNAEVLVRLYDEAGHTLLPDDFVALAEQYDVVNALDRAVIKRVVGTLNRTAMPGRVSCNVSPHSLLDPSFVDWASDLISVSKQGQRLVLELTERLPIGRVPTVRDGMHQLRAGGVKFALDDFGAGTTSYGNLRELPVDVLKIDGTLTRGALTSTVDRAMMRSTIEVAQALHIKTIAEGVETSEQLAHVQALGADAVQGYYFGQPTPWPAKDAVI